MNDITFSQQKNSMLKMDDIKTESDHEKLDSQLLLSFECDIVYRMMGHNE